MILRQPLFLPVFLIFISFRNRRLEKLVFLQQFPPAVNHLFPSWPEKTISYQR